MAHSPYENDVANLLGESISICIPGKKLHRTPTKKPTAPDHAKTAISVLDHAYMIIPAAVAKVATWNAQNLTPSGAAILVEVNAMAISLPQILKKPWELSARTA